MLWAINDAHNHWISFSRRRNVHFCAKVMFPMKVHTMPIIHKRLKWSCGVIKFKRFRMVVHIIQVSGVRRIKSLDTSSNDTIARSNRNKGRSLYWLANNQKQRTKNDEFPVSMASAFHTAMGSNFLVLFYQHFCFAVNNCQVGGKNATQPLSKRRFVVVK